MCGDVLSEMNFDRGVDQLFDINRSHHLVFWWVYAYIYFIAIDVNLNLESGSNMTGNAARATTELLCVFGKQNVGLYL